MKALMRGLLALALAVPMLAHAQTSAVLNPPVTVDQCAAWTDIYGTLHDSGIGCANHQLTISDGTHGSMVFAPSTILLPNSPAILNTTSGQPLLFIKGVASAGADGVDFDFRRLANYTGGTFGYVNSAARFYTVVSAGADSFEWPLQCVLDNSALVGGNSQDACGYFQAIKRGTAATWAFVDELIDLNADPVAGSVTAEHDLRATGTDVHNQRVQADYFATSQNGAAATVTYGIRLNTDGLTTITHGLTLNGNYGTSAINIPTGSKFCWNGLTCTYTLAQSGGTLTYTTPTGGVLAVTSGGALSTFGSITTAGNLQLPSGQKLCLDGTGCANYISQSGGDVEIVGTTKVGLGLTTALALNTGTGPITGGTITGSTLVTTGGVQIPSGQKLNLDGATGNNTISQSGGTVTITAGGTAAITATSSTVGLGNTTALALNTGTGSITGGAIQGSTVTSTGNIVLATNQKLCLNGATCTIYLTFDGTSVIFGNAGASKLYVSASSGQGGFAGAVTSGLGVGQTCPAGSHATTGGITTTC